MSVQLNHTIVAATDREASAQFLAGILGLPDPKPYGPFLCVEVDNAVSLDYAHSPGPIPSMHLAFLVTEDDFDVMFGRIKDQGVAYWADPHHERPGEINTRDGGRGVYFADADGHNLELLTRPYGSGSD
jgi:catechol 2,3-dioxygenase-like lactoylglutathione lyase family enzyme